MLWSFDPFQPLVSQMARTPGFLPAVDVSVSDGDLVLTLDVPGLAEEDLSIELVDGYLTVRGERRRPELGDRAAFTHRERAFGSFERRIKVPDGVDGDAITASLDHGVLSLIVPKPEQLKPKTITIGTGGQRQLETSTT